jgi:hypothetical protein
VSKGLKQERGRELAAVEAELRDAYYATLRGMRLKVLVESPPETGQNGGAGASARLSSPQAPAAATLIGTSCRYAPVEIDAADASIGHFANVVAGPAVHDRIRALDATS